MASLPTPGGSDVWGANLNAAIESLHLTGTHASRPTTSLVTGTLYACTDHNLIYRWNGSAWGTYATLGGGGGGTDRPLVDPTGYSWSWINQGVASVANQGASILLSSPAESADSWHFRVKAVPAKPYSVIIHQKVTRLSVNYSSAGVGWLQSSNNYFAGLFQRGGGLVLSSAYSQAPFGLTANYLEMSADRIWEWIKLTDDATSRKIYVSADGYNWVLYHSVATNDIITPDRLFFGIEARNGTYGIGQMIDSWEEGA